MGAGMGRFELVIGAVIQKIEVLVSLDLLGD